MFILSLKTDNKPKIMLKKLCKLTKFDHNRPSEFRKIIGGT